MYMPIGISSSKEPALRAVSRRSGRAEDTSAGAHSSRSPFSRRARHYLVQIIGDFMAGGFSDLLSKWFCMKWKFSNQAC